MVLFLASRNFSHAVNDQRSKTKDEVSNETTEFFSVCRTPFSPALCPENGNVLGLQQLWPLLKSTSPSVSFEFSLDNELVPLQEVPCQLPFTVLPWLWSSVVHFIYFYQCCFIYFFWLSSYLRQGYISTPCDWYGISVFNFLNDFTEA